MEKVAGFDAHADYIRSIAVHPTQTLVLTSSDDQLIKLWDWSKNWQCIRLYEGHTHYVMQASAARTARRAAATLRRRR